MSDITINIEGMSCQHCVMGVKKAIGALKGIEQSDVSVGNAVVKYDESKVKKEEIETAIEKAGFKVSK
ncbi:MAG: cation transporter [Proteobacteria bacterium]|nr:cation transporter [Pseudomonadota bacterium]